MRISSSGSRSLTRAGREVHIKSVLQSIPSYIMCTYLIPPSVCEEIERMMSSYFCGFGGANAKGIKWMSWTRLSEHKARGGMGFRRLHAFNLAMLGKQAWKLVTQQNFVFSKLLKAKYFPIGSFMDAKLGHNPSYVWRDLF